MSSCSRLMLMLGFHSECGVLRIMRCHACALTSARGCAPIAHSAPRSQQERLGVTLEKEVGCMLPPPEPDTTLVS